MREAATQGRTHGSDGRRRRTSALTAEARARRGSAEFLPSFAALQERVRDACAAQEEWQAKIVAGVRAALEFCAADPAAARALTVTARREAAAGREPDQEVIAYFAQMLVDVAPAENDFPAPAAVATIESIATVVRGHLVAGTADRLPAAGADLIYLTLLSRLGSEGLARWIDVGPGAN
jgi:hypothetical protein